MWDSLLVPRAVKIQKQNGGVTVHFSEITRPKYGKKKVLIEHFLKIREKNYLK